MEHIELNGGSLQEMTSSFLPDSFLHSRKAEAAAIAKMSFMGYGIVDLGGPVKPRFRLRPLARTLDNARVNLLVGSYAENGVQDVENPINMTCPPTFIENVDRLTKVHEKMQRKDFPLVVWSEEALQAKEVDAADGQHREASMMKFKMLVTKDLQALRALDERAPPDEDLAVTQERQDRIVRLQRMLFTLGTWLVAFYCSSAYRITSQVRTA